jgi:hypothetical protein
MTPSPSPQDDHKDYTDSSDSFVFICDTPGDTTRRPSRPNTPRPYWLDWLPPEAQPPAKDKPEDAGK